MIGVVDLVDMKAYSFEGANGQDVTAHEIPAELVEQAEEYREKLIDAASMFSDDLMEAALEGEVSRDLLVAAIREGTISLQMCPVFLGTAYKNKGVQKLLDGVVDYLPCPTDVENNAPSSSARTTARRRSMSTPIPAGPFAALAFKLEDGRYGQLTYLRIYRGTLNKGDFIYNTRNNKRVKVGRLVRMHSNEMEDIDSTSAGDIVALFGVDCYSGDTFTDGSEPIAMTSIFVPDAVISLTVTPKDSKAQINMSKALQRFSKEDPTFRVNTDQETGDTVISGMGELHLDVYIERMKREYNAEVDDLAAARVLPRDHLQGGRVRLHPQEADRWLGSVGGG